MIELFYKGINNSMLKQSFFYYAKCIFFSIFLFQNIAHCEELQIISAEHFIAENPSAERKVIVKFITEQFYNKKEKGVTQTELSSIWNNLELRKEMQLLRFQIVNQELYADAFDRNHMYFKPLKDYFQYLLKKYKIHDVDFIVHAKDEINKNPLNSFPLTFMMSKNLNSKYEKDRVLMPDSHMIDKGRNWYKLSKEIEKTNKITPWESKINKIFWRGGATGAKNTYLYNVTNFDKLIRLKLVMFSKLYPDLIDAEITAYYEFSANQDGDNLKQILNTLFSNKEKRVDEIEHLKYKYLIAVDGNTCSWLRVPWIMLSNSVLLKQETSNIEWFYSALKPYIHYVPINEDLTDIFSKLDWMQKNDDKLKEISLNAQNFIKNDLMPEHIEKHMVIILNEYSYIQKDNDIKITLPKVDFQNNPTKS